MTKEIEENYKSVDEAIKLPSDDKLTKDHLNMLDAEHEKHFNAYSKAKPMSDSASKHAKKMDIISGQMDHVRGVLKNKAKTNESVDEAYSEKNPKIDLHHKETGEYLTSTNWSPTIKHAISTFEQKYPDMVGKVKGYKAKTNESVDEAPKGTLVSEMIESILGDELVESTKQFKSILSEKFSEKLDEVKRTISKSILSKED